MMKSSLYHTPSAKLNEQVCRKGSLDVVIWISIQQVYHTWEEHANHYATDEIRCTSYNIDKVCQQVWFSQDTSISSTNKMTTKI